MTEQNVLKDAYILGECTLYQAARWIALSEKPISKNHAEELYPYYGFSDGEDEDFGFITQDNLLEYQLYTKEYKAFVREYSKAKSVLLSFLEKGEIKACGYHVQFKDFVGREKKYLSAEREEIDSKCWINDWKSFLLNHPVLSDSFKNGKIDGTHMFDIDWAISELRYLHADNLRYEDIRIDFMALSKAFPIKEGGITFSNSIPKKEIETRGRKPKFDWHNHIYPEIAVYIHKNGNVENANKMAQDIYTICSQKYGEDNTPDIETIRKLATSPITRRFKFGNN